MSAAATISMRSRTRAGSTRCSNGQAASRPEPGQGSTFRVGPRSRCAPAARRGQSRCRRQADRRGQGRRRDYVQTPEMTNIMEVNRDKLFAAIVPEENDASLATFRELARKLSIYLHIGSLAIKVTPDKAANRVVPDRSAGRDRRALRQDPHVRRRSGQRRELPRVAQLPAGRARRAARPAVGPARPHVCYDLRFPALYRALAEAGASFLAIPSAFTRQTGEAHWHVLNRARAHRERLLRAGGGAGRQARERPRDVRPFAGGRSLGPHPRRGRHRARRRAGRDRSGRGRGGARPRAVAAARPPLRAGRADGGADPSARGAEARHDPLFARLRAQARIRNLVQELRRLRQAGEARAW